MANVTDIRQGFLDFFHQEGHEKLPSSPLVPRNDPTLMFTNSGMVQFKNIFTGQESRSVARATTAQKCVRAGGKHNDLENVGSTARHHTFFEMLGNFSFGDYFKERAIELAWRLITDRFQLPKDRLLVTIFHEDDEAATYWKKIANLPDDRIIRISTNDNFWSMGDTGPCGPCSEIFFDHGSSIPGGPPGSPDQDGDRFIEIWNLVFMQFDQLPDGKRVALPKPSIDTGMGLERIAAVLQGKHDNYDIDLMRALIEASAHLSSTEPEGAHKISHRVIADHLRASSFLIADGVLPSNEGRGYVLRRIMRRAMRHVHKLGVKEPLLYRLVPVLIAQMGAAYPELRRAQALVEESLKLEETRFRQTLERGLKLLEEETTKLPDKDDFPGDVAFKLYDTFGFPLDLTQDILRAEGRKVDLVGFDHSMEAQRALARKAWSGTGEAATETIWFDLRQKFGVTEFLGYNTEKAEGQIQALIAEGQEQSEAKAGEKVAVILNQTPFYGESGGQMADRGRITNPAGGTIEITDVQRKLGDVFVHFGLVKAGIFKPGDVVHLEVNSERRDRLRIHHSATHLLHEALRRKLGTHVVQKGSLVSDDRLRFDFSHGSGLTADEILVIEQEVNRRIRLNEQVQTRLMSPKAAMEAGALALFGEKYGEEVRVVSMGGRLPDEKQEFSTELCGGTHVQRTGDIGYIKITSESAVGAGIRRLEAVAGPAAMDYIAKSEEDLRQTIQRLQVQLVAERKKSEKELSELRRKMAAGAKDSDGASGIQEIAGVKFIGRQLEDVPAKELKMLADQLKDQVGSGIIAIVTADQGRASLIVGVSKDLTNAFNAVDLVRAGAQALGGQGGGGRPDLAQAGGPDPSKASEALAAIQQAINDVRRLARP